MSPATPPPVPPELAEVARVWYSGGHVADAVAVASELSATYWGFVPGQRSLAAAIHAVAAKHSIPAVPEKIEPGARLFNDIVTALREHYYLDSEWHYIVTALFIMQAPVVCSLPAVFYLFFGGRYGSGKTNILELIRDLTGGLLLENVSIAALARLIKNGRVVCIDEADVSRGKDIDEAREALIRQGYKATAAPYMRFNVNIQDVEPIPIYGPKALSFRGSIEESLLSRGFLIPTVAPAGAESYRYVTRNLYPRLRDLPVRVQLWGARAAVEFPTERVQAIAESPEFAEKVAQVVTELGANRESELVTVALLTAELAGVDILHALRSAAEQRESSSAEASDEVVAELAEVVIDLAAQAGNSIDEEAAPVVIQQGPLLKELNRRRVAQRQAPINYGRLARARRELGIPDQWLRTVHKSLRWQLDPAYLDSLRAGLAGLSTPPTPPPPPLRHGGNGEAGELGDPRGVHLGAPRLPVPLREDDLFAVRPTRGDNLRAREGAR